MSMAKIIVRVDSSSSMGTGHLIRCLTLADRLREGGAEVSFICRELPGTAYVLAERKGYSVHRVPTSGGKPGMSPGDLIHGEWLGVSMEEDGADTEKILKEESPAGWLVVDHYGLDSRWESRMRPRVGRIMAIDDLANRPHDCDILLDQNLARDLATRYCSLVPPACRKFLGPRYALLRPEFLEVRKTLRERTGQVRRILVFFGGADLFNETGKALEAIRRLGRPDIAADVIVGVSNPHRLAIEETCALMPNVTCGYHVADMAERMAAADLAVGAGGTSLWERCSLGLPSLTLIVAENQAEATFCLAAAGGTRNLGRAADVDVTALHDALQDALGDPHGLLEMGRKATAVLGGEEFENGAPLACIILGAEDAAT